MSDRIEYCAECGDPTGRAGPLDDSLYPGGEGPYCEDCFSEWPDWKVAEITTLRQQLEQAKARVAKLEAEALYLRARDDALVDFLCNESGVDLVSVKAACGHIPREDAWLLRKQAEAVEEIVDADPDGRSEDGVALISVSEIWDYAQSLRQQADEAEQEVSVDE